MKVVRKRERGSVAVVGGAGFIGSNLANSLMSDGIDVLVVDNLSRPGVSANLDWLKARAPQQLHFARVDVANAEAIADALADVDAVFHFAAQTAVTTSLDDPADDFRVNALGTFNVLEAVRRGGRPVPVIYSSTNKVYGALEHVEFEEGRDRYAPKARELREHGVSEREPLRFCTPYGCSKGVADQYVLDYAASYGIPTAVLRMSCIYGPRQFGTEDQGWVAHFLIRALEGKPITVFGNGKQVRDVLFVDDAIAAYRGLLDRIDTLSGRAFNLGGGPGNAVSLNEVLAEIERMTGEELPVRYDNSRTGDQPYFVADTRALEQALGWRAAVDWRQGLRRLWGWLGESRDVLRQPLSKQRALA